MNAFIEDIAVHLPAATLDNEQLGTLFPDWSAGKIEQKTGIRSRHIAAEGETALDLGLAAAGALLKNKDRNSVDALLFCTQSPDYFLPTGACILQDKLGLRTDIAALDYNLGCSGYVYGLALARGLIASGAATRVLLVTAETYSKHIHEKDRGNRTIFGDGAAATLVGARPEPGIGAFCFGTDGRGAANLIVPNGGMRNKHDASAVLREYTPGSFTTDNNLFMNGPEIFNFTIGIVEGMVANSLEKNGCTVDDIDRFVFHQANRYMLDYLRKKLALPEEKFHIGMQETGNTVSATIPIALADCRANGMIKPGNRVLLAGFGVGYSWAGTVITF